jgi:hypothetical protein
MKTQYDIVGKLPLERNRFNHGWTLGKEGDPETVLSYGYSCKSSAEQGMRWHEKNGCFDCRIAPSTEVHPDLGMSFKELVS